MTRNRDRPGWEGTGECFIGIVLRPGRAGAPPARAGAVPGAAAVVHDHGTEVDTTAGTASVIEPGPDARVADDEPAVAFEFDSSAAQTIAKPS